MAVQASWIFLLLALTYSGRGTTSYQNYEYMNQENLYDTTYQRSYMEQQDQGQNVELKMPHVRPVKHDSYFCTSVPLQSDETYIVGYAPHAEMHTAHHMLMFGCSVPASLKKSWNCGDMGAGVCAAGSPEKIMYAWGRNAPALELPKGVAFKVGKSSVVKHLVLQVHYGKVDKFVKNPKLRDESGVTVKTTNVKPDKLAAILLMASGGSIPAHEEAWHLNIGCAYKNSAVMHPFAFRVHTHSLGTVVSGYRIRDKKWTLIGKGDPQRPQAFYPTKKIVDIQDGDDLASRCTYNTMKRDRITYIGATMKDEMCNFYMMFYYDPSQLKPTDGSPEDSCLGLREDMYANFPADSDKPLPGSGKKMEMKRDNLADNCASRNCEPKRSLQPLLVEAGWPVGGAKTGQLPFNSGQITAVALNAHGKVVIFHRASRSWSYDTFDEKDKFTRPEDGPIPQDTVAWLEPETGKVIKQWGAGKFFLPHGLSIDHENNLWFTDVAMHQVFKYSLSNLNQPLKLLLTLGEKLMPGSDHKHFCKPTDVAIDLQGNFFVSDGYCNRRVLKFSPTGKFLMEINKKDFPVTSPPPHDFLIPHTASLDHDHNILYIADRENGRVLAFSANTGSYIADHRGFGSRVFAAHFSPAEGGILHIVNGQDGVNRVIGFTYNPNTKKIIQQWEPTTGFIMPHDLASDSSNKAVYVAEAQLNRIWKFTRL